MSTPAVTPQPDQQFQYIKLPDGSYGKFRADAADASIKAAISKDFPDAYAKQQPGILPMAGSMLASRLGIDATPEEVSSAGTNLGSDLLGMAKAAPKAALTMQFKPIMEGVERAQQGLTRAQTGELPPEAQHYQEQKQSGYSLPYRLLTPIAEGLGANVRGMEQSASAGDRGGVVGHAAAVPVAMAATEGTARLLPKLLTPISDAIPSKANAGKTFSSVMAKAGDVPIDISAPGNSALRIQELADRGASMPMVVRKFLKRVTDPEMGPMTYKEARDFQSNVSRLSADEAGRLTPAVRAEVSKFAASLKDSVANAAEQVGQGANYRGAMKEYRQAARLGDFVEGAKDLGKDAAIKGLGYGAGGVLGGYLLQNLLYPNKK